MKKVKQSKIKTYVTTRLYIDELLKIESILSQGEGFEIVADGYSFDSVSDLYKERQGFVFNTVEISISKPYVNLEFGKLNSRLYCGSDDVLSEGLFAKLDSVLDSSRLRPSWLYTLYFIFSANILFAVGVLYLDMYSSFFQILSNILLVWSIWVFYVRGFRTSLVTVEKKNAKKNFLIRNLDQIAVGLIIALFSILGTLYIPRLFSGWF